MREQLEEVPEHRVLQDLGVECRHSVHVVRTDYRHVRHSHFLVVAVTPDHRQALLFKAVAWVPFANLFHKQMIDEIYEIHMSGEQVLYHVDTPLLESFRQHCVISVREGVRDDVPCLIISESLNVEQLSEELNGGDDGVSVVHLNLVEFREVVPVRVVQLETFDDVLDSRAAEEVLLLQTQFLTLPLRVIGVEHRSDILCTLTLHDRFVILGVVEFLKVEFV